MTIVTDFDMEPSEPWNLASYVLLRPVSKRKAAR